MRVIEFDYLKVSLVLGKGEMTEWHGRLNGFFFRVIADVIASLLPNGIFKQGS